VPILVTGRHRPHEVLFLAFSTAIGIAFLVGARPPNAIEQLVPGWVLWSWYLLLLASGGIGLIGIAQANAYRALVLELAAMHGQVAAPLLYGLALLSTGQPSVGFAATFCLTWAGASAWRGWQAYRGIRVLRQVGQSGGHR
jgi:hypothetical protein